MNANSSQLGTLLVHPSVSSDSVDRVAIRGTILHCRPQRPPSSAIQSSAIAPYVSCGIDNVAVGDAAGYLTADDFGDPIVQVIEDGVVLIRGERILAVASADLLTLLDDSWKLVDYRGCLVIPGLVDSHVHYPQTEMIGSYGEQLLSWLDNCTFPMERRFEDFGYAQRVAELFVGQLVAHGTTTAAVYGTVHTHSIDALFGSAQPFGLQLIAGKVLMDRNCPEFLQDTPDRSYEESRQLIERWHGVLRCQYAVTPRFAPTSSSAQLQCVAQLLDEFPTVYMQTHVAENADEVRWVRELFPDARSYLDVYEQHRLLRPRSILGHSIHLDAEDHALLTERGAKVAFCPSSNLFLGSGLFDLERARNLRHAVGIGTDVGAGTGFSVLRTLGEGYKVAQLSGCRFSPAQMLHMATIGGAEALSLHESIGSFDAGKFADVVVLDPSAVALSQARDAISKEPLDRLFALTVLSDDRHVRATYIAGSERKG